MRVAKNSLLDFIGQEKVLFSIPPFQRPYSWDLMQCEELWRDIQRAANSRRSHFMGALMYKQEDIESEHKTLSIIDGQQRILSMLLLLSALECYLRTNELSLYGMDCTALTNTYLKNGQAWRIQPARIDRETFIEALEEEPLPCMKQSRAMSAKNFFLNKITTPEFNVLDFWRGLLSLSIVAVELNENDDAQTIFASFNSKGVPLVTADLVRNYLLMAENSKEQRRLHEDFWGPIQGLFGDDPGSLRLNGAIRAWTTIRCKGARAKSDAETFSVFRRYCESEYSGGVEDLLSELFSFCMVWAENYRYHAVKKYRSANWAKLGRKTLVSDRKRVEVSKESWDYYTKHFGVNSQW